MSLVLSNSNKHIILKDIPILYTVCKHFDLSNIELLELEHLKKIRGMNLGNSYILNLYTELHLRGYYCLSKGYRATFPRVEYPCYVIFSNDKSSYNDINFKALGLDVLFLNLKANSSNYFHGLFLNNLKNICKDVNLQSVKDSFLQANFEVIEFVSFDSFNEFEPENKNRCEDINSVYIDTLTDFRYILPAETGFSNDVVYGDNEFFNHKILNLYYETKFKKLRDYCSDNKLVYIRELSPKDLFMNVKSGEQALIAVSELLSFKRIIGEFSNDLLITDIFEKACFKSFIEECINKNMIYLKDISGLTKKDLGRFKGLGTEKINRVLALIYKVNDMTLYDKLNIIQKNNNYVKTKLSNSPTYIIHDDFKDISLNVLKSFNLKQSFLDILLSNSSKTMGMFNNLSYQAIFNIYNIRSNKLYTALDIINKKSIMDVLSNFSFLSESELYIAEHLFLKNETLQTVSENFTITRERIRQIKILLCSKIRSFLFNTIFKDFVESSSTVLFKFDFDNGLVDCIVKNSLKKENILSDEEYNVFYYSDLNVFVVNDTENVVENIVLDFVSSKSGTYSVSGLLFELNDIFKDYNISFGEENLINLFPDCHVTNDTLILNQSNIKPFLLVETLSFFKDGVCFRKESESLIAYANKCKSLNIALPPMWECDEDEIRNVMNRVSTHTVLCGRRKFTHIKNVIYDYKVMDDIYNFIIKSKDEVHFYKSLFEKFKDRLLNYGNVTNAIILHGLLKFLFGESFSFRRDNLSKADSNIDVERSLTSNLEKILISRKSVLHYNDIHEIMPGIENHNINQAKCSENIIAVGEKKLIHKKYFIVSPEETFFLSRIIESQLKELHGYCSVKKLYEDYGFELYDLFVKFKIDKTYDFTMFLRSLFSERYIFFNMYISKKEIDSPSINDLFAKHFKGDLLVSKDSIKSFKKQYSLDTDKSIDEIFYDIVLNNFKDETDIISTISNMLDKKLTSDLFANLSVIQENLIDYDVNFDFTIDTIACIIDNFVPDVCVIDKPNYIIARSSYGIKNKEDMIRYILNREFKNTTYISFNDIQDVFAGYRISIKNIDYFKEISFISIINKIELEVIHEP